MIKGHFGEGCLRANLKNRPTVILTLPRNHWAVLEEAPVRIDHQVRLAHVRVVLGAKDSGKSVMTSNEGSKLFIAYNQMLIHYRKHSQNFPFVGSEAAD